MGRAPNDGGPAFPIPSIHDSNGCGIAEGAPGMSLRDWFAGQALTGMLDVCRHDSLFGDRYLDHVARNAYDLAEAMLTARAALYRTGEGEER